jgi:hypothetical protein
MVFPLTKDATPSQIIDAINQLNSNKVSRSKVETQLSNLKTEIQTQGALIVPTLPSVNGSTVGVIGQLGLFNGRLYVCLGPDKLNPNIYLWSQVNGGGVLVTPLPTEELIRPPKTDPNKEPIKLPTQELADQAP